ncbi:cation-transporting P-type ATPase, partial [Legionella pneumophila]
MAEQWHEKSPTEIASQCNIDLSLGLSEKEAKLRLKEVGPNLLSKQKRTSPFIIFLQQFESVVIWVLLGAVLVSFLLDEKADAIAILAIVILNAIIGFFL